MRLHLALGQLVEVETTCSIFCWLNLMKVLFELVQQLFTHSTDNHQTWNGDVHRFTDVNIVVQKWFQPSVFLLLTEEEFSRFTPPEHHHLIPTSYTPLSTPDSICSKCTCLTRRPIDFSSIWRSSHSDVDHGFVCCQCCSRVMNRLMSKKRRVGRVI